MAKRLNWEPVWMERIIDSLNGIQFGSVQIVIHDGKIVQIERTEKRRFEGTSTGQETANFKNH